MNFLIKFGVEPKQQSSNNRLNVSSKRWSSNRMKYENYWIMICVDKMSARMEKKQM